MLEFKRAVRHSLPMQGAFYGPSGSGKTLSALLFASGLSVDGKVGVIDTEKGRASLHADNKKLLAVMPNGFDVIEIGPTYHPKLFIEAMKFTEDQGYRVCIIDSGSDSWDGPGGCTDIAEDAKGMWNGAKLWNKRMMVTAALSDMHIIWCLKAQDKTKIIDKSKSASGKQEYLDLGMTPIWEKNNFYPMLYAFSVDPKTHESTLVKASADAMWDLFPKPHLIGREDGERLRKWNDTGSAMAEGEQLRKRARMAADDGIAAYQEFFGGLTPAQRKMLEPVHGELKAAAVKADKERETSGEVIA